MSRKQTIVDDLQLNHPGVYCVFPYERKDKHGNAVFKIGITTTSFRSRIEQYHSTFPQGVYIVAFLSEPKLPHGQTKKVWYMHIENWVISEMERLGADVIHSSTRIAHPNDEGLGRTEFVYTSESVVKSVFRNAKTRFEGDLHLYSLAALNRSYEQNLKSKPNYRAEIIVPLTK